ncbi:MAG: adaptor protein MecA [Clostridia bacterium]|nr:adaptor protein MecA [Clostridia bacterium]
MEHILISPGKLKLMLTKDDLDHYELDCDCIDCDNPSTRRALRSMLDDARRLSGFDAASDKIFVQLYPSKDGGAEIYITKLNTPAADLMEPVDDNRKVTVSDVWGFAQMDDLLHACAHIERRGFDGDSSAWSDGRRCYLLLEEKLTYRACLDRGGREAWSFLGDYGRNLAGGTALSYIREHCRCFCDAHAVQTLAGME